jgi:hypothetical protein
VRSFVIYSLKELGRADERALDGLLALARDDQVAAGMRSEAASALGELDRADEAVETLLALARDNQVDDEVRSSAAYTLQTLLGGE